ncbi:glycoside hydrolase family 18 protein [Bacillus mycoides]|uniref:chitinase n=1 Tax=Bacillus mycoides TaxID=1405 RepID=UPI00366DCDA0
MEHKPLIMGYWHNWSKISNGGYQYGSAAEVDLTDVPKEYNVIVVSDMRGPEIPTFKPFNKSDKEFREQVDQLALEGRQVLINLGGADAYIELHKGMEADLANEIIRLETTYGFSGICIDLEQSAINAADNCTVIPAALKIVKDSYKNEGKDFLIALAPEFPSLLAHGKYLPYLEGLEGYYDLVCPQFYNQGGHGLWVEEVGSWITSDDNERKEDFLYYVMNALASGARGFTKLPHDKLIMGLPANRDAAGSGYVVDPSAVLNAMERLKKSGNAIRGLAAWSINWDAGQDKNGQSYSYEFINRYKDIATRV